MNIILLSGGAGKRLWPLSNDSRSKQFLKILKDDEENYESMIQRMFRMIKKIDADASIVVATSESQVSTIRSQIDEDFLLSLEPCRKDTFPAIVLAASYLHDILGLSDEETVVTCPVDVYADVTYYQTLQELAYLAEKGESNLVLMGIEPTYPSIKYGYILTDSKEKICNVVQFREKPDIETAKDYILQGALWNSGIFSYKIKYILEIAKKILGTNSYEELYKNYEHLTKISFDKAVVEHESRIKVIRFNGMWKDIGTWNTLTEILDEEVIGNAKLVDCKNTHIINELQLPILTLGVCNLAVVSTYDGILVIDKESSDKLKEHVIENRPMFEKRIWGEYKVLDYQVHENNQKSLTKHLIISAGKHISYQRHSHRSEIWTFVDGHGKLILDGRITPVTRGDFAIINSGMKHAVKADTELHIIEVQIGDELTEEDIERLEWNWTDI